MSTQAKPPAVGAQDLCTHDLRPDISTAVAALTELARAPDLTLAERLCAFYAAHPLAGLSTTDLARGLGCAPNQITRANSKLRRDGVLLEVERYWRRVRLPPHRMIKAPK